MTIPDLEKIRELEEQLANERAKLAEWDQKPDDDYKLAELLHERFCNHNHTDGCSWFYETGTSHPARHDPWTVGHAHREWLRTARKFKKTAADIQKAVKGKADYKLAEALLKVWPNYFW
jgi:hypothetical protein